MSDQAPAAAHVAATLVYGPVDSRRFGRSLGISFTDPGQWTCAWRCPYCQVGHLPRGNRFADPARLLVELDGQLARDIRPDHLCIAGNGEPSSHPAFAELVPAIVERARRHRLRTTLLSNGDGLLGDTAKRNACTMIDECWIKWDPGPHLGLWRALSAEEDATRIATLASLPRLRIQSLLYRGPGVGQGNDQVGKRQVWLRDLARLQPQVIHLTTIARIPQRPSLQALPAPLLRRRAACAQDRLGIPVIAWP